MMHYICVSLFICVSTMQRKATQMIRERSCNLDYAHMRGIVLLQLKPSLTGFMLDGILCNNVVYPFIIDECDVKCDKRILMVNS